MTASTERRASEEGAGKGAFGLRRRAESASAQEAALPRGRVAVSCPAPLGAGGLGRHLQEIFDALDRAGSRGIDVRDSLDGSSVTSAQDRPRGDPHGRPHDHPHGRLHGRPRFRAVAAALAPAVRFSPAWLAWAENASFDADAARRLPAADHLIAFSGAASAQLRAARGAGMRSASLMSATSHLRRVVRLHAQAHRRYPLERSWATRLIGRSLAEYERADRIYVSSRHAWESFVEEGVAERKLSLFPLTPAPRYTPAGEPRAAGTFEIVYVGSLSVVKGVPLLIDAVRRLDQPEVRLTLVGGWGTRGMRRFVQRACAEDSRIEVSPGDPLPRLHGAALCVHPSWEDGFAYAPAEALACGVPVIVSENTGMKELVDPGRNGLILPTGDLDALTEAIEAACRGDILGG